jgi:hypothetical protein
MPFIGAIIIPLAILAIPLTAIVLSHKRKTQNNKIKELVLQKEILKLEVEKQNGNIKLLEEENKHYDKIIYENMNLNNIPKT